MAGEELDKQIEEVSEKLKKRDEADQKKGEKEFRAAMAKDTAGHVMNSLRVVAAQLNDIQAQIDASNPLAPIIRALGEISVSMTDASTRITTIEQRLVALESGKNAE